MPSTPQNISSGSSSTAFSNPIPLPQLPVSPRHYWLLIVSQMEQTIVNILTIAIGVMLPLLKLYNLHTLGVEPPVLAQGCIAAAGLTGITIGAPLLGAVGDRVGYLWIFRLCGVLIFIGGLGAWLIGGSLWFTVGSLFITGIGIGGGYSLDDVYLSELMPKKQRLTLIGVAKCIAASAACWGALLVFGILKIFPHEAMWRYAMIAVAAMGLITILMRIRWWESPRWLLNKGRKAEALEAARHFFGPNVELAQFQHEIPKPVPFKDMFKGQTLWKVIATSVPWALDGIGAYGMGAYLPMFLMSLGLHIGATNQTGVASVQDSVLLSAIINIFMTVGFTIGLLVMKRIYHITLMTTGFIIGAISIGLVMAGHAFGWPGWIGIVAFILFETSLSGGPGLVTFVLPAEVFTINERGTGSGIAAAVGKAGAVISVFLMPMILKSWGIEGAMAVCAGSMVLGAVVTAIAGPKALPRTT